ncbi:MAG: DNA adenine methylase [Candidatus Microsaccharimonas sp.]
MIKPKAQRKHLYTPLRYPGGKTSLFEFFANVFIAHKWKHLTYVEPYAGGAGAALSLLILGHVDKIIINDFDKAVFSFWDSIIHRTDEFVDLIRETPITIDEWSKQKLIHKAGDHTDPLALGFATFYLNRTNRSGILNGGPIGGHSQGGEWKLDARYKKEKLIEKIELIASYRDKITILNDDGIDVIKKYAHKKEVFMYVDPPYFVKGANLYLNAFKIADHEKLAQTLKDARNTKWLLSYDKEQEILDLYKDMKYEVFSLKYSVHHNTRLGSEVMIFSDSIEKELIDIL